MTTKDVVVTNEIGLHAKPARLFIDEANKYVSCIFVEKDERRINAKSLLGVLSMGISGGQVIRIMANGPDEEAAVRNLVGLIENNFVVT